MRSKLLALVRPLVALAGKQLFWLTTGLAALIVILAALSTGRSALARAHRLEARADTLARVLRQADHWLLDYQAPAAAESAAWRRSERDVRDLGVRASDRIAVAHVVTQRAEELGIAQVRVRLEPPDTLTPPAPRVVDEWSFEMGSVLAVEMGADFPAVVSFIGALPPQVEVRQVRLARTGEAVRTRFILITRALSHEGASDTEVASPGMTQSVYKSPQGEEANGQPSVAGPRTSSS